MHVHVHTHRMRLFLTIYFLLSLRGQTSTLPSPAWAPAAAVGKYLVLQLLRCHAERDDLDHFRARRVLQSELIMAPSVAFPLLVGWFERLCHAFVIFGHLKVKKKKE